MPFDYKEEIPTPIINKLEQHFLSFIEQKNQKGKSITKYDVIRILLDKLDTKTDNEKAENLKNIYSLIAQIKLQLSKLSQ